MKIGINEVLRQIRLFFVPYLVLLCGCLVIKIMFTRQVIYFAVNSSYFALGDQIAPYVTDMGNGWTIVILSALLVLFNYRAAFLMASSYAITSLTAQLVKFIFAAPRPTLLYKSKLSAIHLVKGVDMLRYNSFPSGHTVSIFSAVIVVIYLIKNKNWSIPLLLLAVAVGYSRMYLSQHFFEDVVAGSIIGLIVTACWISYIDSKQFLHTQKWNRGLLKTNLA